MGVQTIKKDTIAEQLLKANVLETARIASNYTIEEQIAVAAVLDEEVMRAELDKRRREEKIDLQAIAKIANRKRNYRF